MDFYDAISDTIYELGGDQSNDDDVMDAIVEFYCERYHLNDAALLGLLTRFRKEERLSLYNRSLQQDFDINYHTRAFRERLASMIEDINMIRAVGHEPTDLLIEMEEAWKNLTDELQAI